MIKAIMAVDHEWGIGKGGKMPWPPNKEDLKQFKEKTTGNTVVMGSKTWNSDMPAPLPNRRNYVITKQASSNFQGATGVISENVNANISALDRGSDGDTWIIGGAEIIRQTLPIIEELHLTVVSGMYDCDVKMDISEILHTEFLVDHMQVTPNNSYYVYKRYHGSIY